MMYSFRNFTWCTGVRHKSKGEEVNMANPIKQVNVKATGDCPPTPWVTVQLCFFPLGPPGAVLPSLTRSHE